MHYISQHLPIKSVTTYKLPRKFKVLQLDRNPDQREILLLGFYQLPSFSENCFLLHLENAISNSVITCENTTLPGNFNVNGTINKTLKYLYENISFEQFDH